MIKVKSVDKATTTPLTGRLIVHSPHLDEIYKKLGSHPDKMLIDYSEDDFPNGYAAAFCA
ncbi:MAG: hypothetical protein HY747_06655 [Elusimicrobia bacterium]|nr:hypothetical protein [Elusimicrobiota bacterium]